MATARNLIASNLRAARNGLLLTEHEVKEKELLEISRKLGVGAEATSLGIAAARSESQRSLAGLEELTLTLIEGDFPREVIREHDLTFAPFELEPGERPERKRTRTSGSPPANAG